MADKMSAMKAALRGLASGGTMGFSDELGGTEQMGLNSLAKHLPQGLGDALGIETRYHDGLDSAEKAYTSGRDQNRAEDAKAEEDHPVVYNVSDVVGGMVPGMAGGLAGGAKAGAAAARVAARRYATAGAEKAAQGLVERAAKKAALESMMKQGAVQGAVSAYGNGTKDAADLGNVVDMADGAAGGAGGALVGHGIGKAVGYAKGALPSISKKMAKFAKPEAEVAKTIKSVGAGSDRARAVDEAYEKILNDMEDNGAAETSKHKMRVHDMTKDNFPAYKAKPTKGLKGKELMDAIGDNLDYKDTDFSDLLPAEGMTDKMAPDRAARLARASAETNAGGKAGKAAADEEEVFLNALKKKDR